MVHYLDIKTYVTQFFVLIIIILIFINIYDYNKRKLGKYWWKIRPSDYTFLRKGLQYVPKDGYNYLRWDYNIWRGDYNILRDNWATISCDWLWLVHTEIYASNYGKRFIERQYALKV